jgi:hypothetical protein
MPSKNTFYCYKLSISRCLTKTKKTLTKTT